MVIGIDLGTTYSAAARVDENDIPRVINNSEGSNTTPSVVFFEDENHVVVGEIAQENAVMHPMDVVSVVKNSMGKKVEYKTSDGKSYTPEMVSSFILRKMVGDSEAALGEKVTGAVVTVPAYFTDAQRKATEDAAAMAGIHLLGLLNEPTAAALCYTNESNIRNETVMIYDLGGGTFDVTILFVDGDGKIKVLSTGGIREAGGKFFDQKIVDGIVKYMKKEHDIDLEDDEYLDELQELYTKVENAKRQLSSRDSAVINLKIDRVREQITITREQFEEIVGKEYDRTEGKMIKALKDAGLKKTDIDKVLLVGGSSRIPYIAKSVAEFIGKEPSREVNPDEAVAIGAAIYAKMLDEENKADDETGSTQTVSTGTADRFTDVCSHSIGVGIKNRKTHIIENHILIKRNSTIPTSNEQVFTLEHEGQKKIELRITEGEFKEMSDVTVLGVFVLDLPPHLPLNTDINISIRLDSSQLVRIHVEIPGHGYSKDFELERKANLDEEDVEEATGILLKYDVS